MALTKTATAATGGGSPKTSPNSITKVNLYKRPSNESAWTTSAPYVLYTAPTTCKYARIVIPHTGKNSDVNSYQQENFKIESSSSHNHWMGIGIVNDTNSTEDIFIRSYSGSTNFPIVLNSFAQSSYGGQYNFNRSYDGGPFGVTVTWYSSNNYYNYGFLHGDRFILNPGEKFVAFTGNNNATNYIYANFQAWVYN